MYNNLCQKDLIRLLLLEKGKDLGLLYQAAMKTRLENCGNAVYLRGLVEFSNHCRNSCLYCGINAENKSLKRYRMSQDEILAVAKEISQRGVKTVVLQSGEDIKMKPLWLAGIIKKIKRNFNLLVTLSVGEHSKEIFALWRKAGADRYLLKIESSTPSFYRNFHPRMSFKRRLNCLKALKKLGYQTGCGNIVGLKDQSLDSLAKDLLFFKKFDFEMLGIGPFIPHRKTLLARVKHGDKNLVLKSIALARLLNKKAYIPATTALGTIGGEKSILDALRAGANVIMPNFTPQKYQKNYSLYDGKKPLAKPGDKGFENLKKEIKKMGMIIL